ncbi:MAG: ribbon-helix-helix domain-containing protein [Nitrosomonas sp.]|nr:ribbon-helix-helix protein, CopG family [Burkholderiales bacterium]MDR4519295.1 ribbon-helix-helix domain-containing protein [Nitrosomonas sp.]MDR4650778.1 ribbon-helix-helix domain-containing protein [Nitrosomonas sp.]
MNTRVVTAHIPSELAEQIDQLAKRMDRSQGWIVKQALMSWVELEAKRSQLTLEGLADVDAGRLVDHAAIDAWAKNLDK